MERLNVARGRSARIESRRLMARKHALAVAALIVCALVLASTALAGNGGLGPPESVSDSGRAISRLYWIIFGICAVVFVLVEGALVWFIFRFRRRSESDPLGEGPQLHGNTRLEVIWTIVPAVILVVIAAFTFASVPTVNASPERGEKPLVVKVTAHQFYWQYEYPNGALTLDTLRVPVGRLVRLELTSPDVIHSWWVPQITGKRDAIPGRVNTLDFRIDQAGVYQGKCAEFCGIEHAVMYTRVAAVPGQDYDAWVSKAAAAQDTPAGELALGKEEYDNVCATCHGLAGEGGIGPPIAGKVTSKAGLTKLLYEGQDQPSLSSYMPPVGLGWSEQQIDDLFEYLTTDPTLSGKGTQANGG